jgi:hypothetical protein
MLKEVSPVPLADYELERVARERLAEVLGDIPFLKLVAPESAAAALSQADFTVELDAAGERWTLVCEVKRLGQPRHVREAVYQLRHRLIAMRSQKVYGVFIAPYLSEESIAVLRGESLGYLDLAGNCFLSFGSVFIERRGAPNPSVRRRELREIFAPKASRVLRVLLKDRDRSWRVTELAQSAGVSLGQTSNVRRALIDREWADTDSSGVRVKNPTALLNAWRGEYQAPVLHETQYYTLLHGKPLEDAIRTAFATPSIDRHLLLASFSAAQWLAPFGRVPGHFFYADTSGEAALKTALQLDSVARGANIVVRRPKDNGVFIDRRQPAPGLWTTGPVQTYLDLAVAGDRGQEAADHLRRETLDRTWHVPR